jgi:hypothetical protein
MQSSNKLDAHTLAGPAMVGPTKSSSSDGYALLRNIHSLGAELT